MEISQRIAEIDELMKTLGLNQPQAAAAVLKETNYFINQSTISRCLDGKARKGTVAFIHYALSNISNKSQNQNPFLLHPDYQGSQTYVLNKDCEYHTHFMRANSEHEAIEKLLDIGFCLAVGVNSSEPDASGEWFRTPPVVDRLDARNCYAVTTKYYREL
jgi:hypothetical protein